MDISEFNDKLCKCTGCYYYRSMSGTASSRLKGCHYCLDTGEPRGIAPVECYMNEGTPYRSDKYEAGDKKRIKLYNKKKKEKKEMAKQSYTTSIKEAAVKAVLVDGEAQGVVRERYGIAVSTLARWLADARKEQKEYFDYADSVQAEQQSVETVEEKPQQTAETVTEEAEIEEVVEKAAVETEENNVENSNRLFVNRLYEDLNGLKNITARVDSIGLINSAEKSVLETLHARVYGFLKGMEWIEKETV